MKRFIPLFALLLGACSTPADVSIESLMHNPLFAERYSEEIVDRMVEFVIFEHPIIEDEAKATLIEKNRKDWQEVAVKARAAQREGMIGEFIGLHEYAGGEVLFLYKDDELHFGTNFETGPGPHLRVLLTTIVNPSAEEVFPDETAIDIGALKTPYGAQSYNIPALEKPILYRTAVLWDNDLELIYGFAQMNPL